MIKNYILIFILTLIMLGSLIYGFSASGSPLESRNRRFDELRVNNIRDLTYSIENYTSTNKRLPDKLNDLKDSSVKSLKDPETDQEYEYSIVGSNAYKLCANFAFESRDNNLYSYDDKFKHPKGYYCFDLKSQSMENLSVNNPLELYTPNATVSANLTNCIGDSECKSNWCGCNGVSGPKMCLPDSRYPKYCS